MERRTWRVVVAAGVLSTMVACFAPREMYTQPSPNRRGHFGEKTAHPGPSTAGSEVRADSETPAATDAKVTVSARLASGTRWVNHDATAIHLVIDNRGDKPLRLGHSQLTLMAAKGQRYPALPLRRVARTTTSRADTVDEYLESTIPPPSHDRAVAANNELTPIPEGVVDPREHVSGLVYFEKVPTEAGPVQLAIQLVDARHGTTIGRIELPMPSIPSKQSPQQSARLDDTSD